MNHTFVITPFTLTLLLSSCAMAPPQPTAQMNPIENYASMSCDQINGELVAVGIWEKHHADTEAYMESQASSMASMDAFAAVLGAIGSSVDPSMASIYQMNAQTNQLGTAQVEASKAQSAAHKTGLAKRRAALGQLYSIKNC